MKEIRNKDTSNEYLIDKTEVLEREIVQFPSLYIEGAAASGKSVAIQMMLDKHPEVKSVVFFMKDERKNPSALLEKVPADRRKALQGVLAQDPRPHYQNDPERIYGFQFAKLEVKFSVNEQVLTVQDIQPLT